MASDKTGIPNSMPCQLFFSLLSWVGYSSQDLEPSSEQGSNLPYPIGTRLPTATVSFLSWILESLQFEPGQYLSLLCLTVFQPLLLLVLLKEIYPVLKFDYNFLVLSLCSVCLWYELEQRVSVIWKFPWVAPTSSHVVQVDLI